MTRATKMRIKSIWLSFLHSSRLKLSEAILTRVAHRRVRATGRAKLHRLSVLAEVSGYASARLHETLFLGGCLQAETPLLIVKSSASE